MSKCNPPSQQAHGGPSSTTAWDPKSSSSPGQGPVVEKKKRHRIIGIREHMRNLEEKRLQQTGPDSWLTRKFAVGLVVGMFGYSYYVYVVRLCIKMVRLDRDRQGGRAQGGLISTTLIRCAVIYLVLYHFLFLMFVWCYMRIINTGPGFARDYVPQTEPPQEEEELVQVEGYRFENLRRSVNEPPPRTSADASGPRADTIDLKQGLASPPEAAPASVERDDDANEDPTLGALGPAAASLAAAVTLEDPEPNPSQPKTSTSTIGDSMTAIGTQPDSNPSSTTFSTTQPITTSPYPPQPHTQPFAPTRTSHESTSRSYLDFPEPAKDYKPAPPKVILERTPPTVPVLTEQYRYDSREGYLRPFRSHRCKHCAAVVLKMDHHCPWVGTCVGARNYKYFYNFLQWSTLYTFYVFLTLLIGIAIPSNPSIDAQQIVILCLSGLFAFFVSSLLIMHTQLILLNLTTIEQMGLERIKSMENRRLTREFGTFGFKGMRKVRREWDREWGRLGKEGNLWWLGSRRDNWRMVMGKGRWGWFLLSTLIASAWTVPIPATPKMDDGLSYVPNPRFSKEGIWMKRDQWPQELQ
ncbi:BZ3500_MvSof-1268-A1-R1_Chr3-1g06106 [Microbotryum saponariae]|uniref:Palmitoyltransferase n=1 Tax=Microbotryum saponariae TaxID=289078 RepID=A0A2X0LDX6_9BASI|nr:BZ3500_MvSof-1268-A1-R1_Chr3-1g06106 [Microbotryum saponariae]SDA03969.1 BZ3501_MvSof-1269-A2-R1_Chr3-2g05791 [Microbotryum saponariae]